jgi:hypothetical protein
MESFLQVNKSGCTSHKNDQQESKYSKWKVESGITTKDYQLYLQTAGFQEGSN